jgi:large subunit ribosomal protein L30
MAKKNQATLKIKWVRSGIAFNRNQKEIVRSLGLRRLQHVVERPDNAVVRGLVAKIPHLVEVLDEEKPSAWGSVAEYTVLKPELTTKAASPEEDAEAAAPEAASETAPQASAEPEAPEPSLAPEPEAPQPRKRARGRKA